MFITHTNKSLLERVQIGDWPMDSSVFICHELGGGSGYIEALQEKHNIQYNIKHTHLY